MRYIDTGSRSPEDALGTWLGGLQSEPVEMLRIQTGYFSAEGLAPLGSLLQHLATRDREINCVLGANEGATVARDVNLLLDLVGSPRTNARIAVVSYVTGLYHPKVYHVTRVDGSQAAYVGSGNLTSSGVTGLNIEAGLVLDSGAGDSSETLERIAAAVDAWFDGNREAARLVRTHDDVAELVSGGVLAVSAPRSPGTSGSRTTDGPAEGVRLEAIVTFPRVRVAPDSVAASTSVRVPADVPSTTTAPTGTAAADPLPAMPRQGFPDYVLFAPGVTTPTSGGDALSGPMLPSGATGLIVRLNKDSARHFLGNSGTANVSIPVAAVGTLRFGIYKRRYERPRAEFPLRMRYVVGDRIQVDEQAGTNIMVYGHAPGESGHGDVRFLVPIKPARHIREYARNNGNHVPEVGDPMMLEWPTAADPVFTATVADAGSSLYDTLQREFESANEQGLLVGGGACWLSAEVASRAPQQ